jgi:hypothetical protein
MPTPKTFAAVLVDVESLLSSIALNAEQLPNLDAAKAPLEAVLAELKVLSTRRANHKAEKQLLSKQIEAAMKRSRDLSNNLRALLKGNLGVRNEKLTEFSVAPLREKRKKKGTETEEPAKPKAKARKTKEPGPDPGPEAEAEA